MADLSKLPEMTPALAKNCAEVLKTLDNIVGYVVAEEDFFGITIPLAVQADRCRLIRAQLLGWDDPVWRPGQSPYACMDRDKDACSKNVPSVTTVPDDLSQSQSQAPATEASPVRQ